MSEEAEEVVESRPVRPVNLAEPIRVIIVDDHALFRRGL